MDNEQVACPSCSRLLPYVKLNAHLDECLGLTTKPATIGVGNGSKQSAAHAPGRSGTEDRVRAANAPIFAAAGDRKRVPDVQGSPSPTTTQPRTETSGVRGNDVSETAALPPKEPAVKRVRYEQPTNSATAGAGGEGAVASTSGAGPSAPPSTSRQRLERAAPLAERLRPRTLDDFVGQDGVVNGPLKALLRRGVVPNAILWGPPGTGMYNKPGLRWNSRSLIVVLTAFQSGHAHDREDYSCTDPCKGCVGHE